MSADYSKDGFATTKAILISKAMRKLTSTIGRQRIALVFTTNFVKRWELCLVIRGQQVVVKH